jgi:hypothetical protein
LPINNNVSLYFEGSANTTVINSPKNSPQAVTFEFWMNNSTQATTASIIAQEGGLKIGLDNGEIYFNIGNLSAKGRCQRQLIPSLYIYPNNSTSKFIKMTKNWKQVISYLLITMH